MASVENSLKYESEVEPGKVRLITSGEFVRAYNRSAWLFYCCISKYKVIRKWSKTRQENVFFLGFPVRKLLELINGRVCEKTDFGYDITLKPEELPVEEGYEAWTKEELYSVVPRVRNFLRSELDLELNESKVRVVNAYKGVEFLGAYVKPYRTYPSRRALRRILGRMKSLDWHEPSSRIQARVNSMFGVLSHHDCWHMRKVLAWQGRLREFGDVTDDCLRFYPDRLKIQKFQMTRSGDAQ